MKIKTLPNLALDSCYHTEIWTNLKSEPNWKYAKTILSEIEYIITNELIKNITCRVEGSPAPGINSLMVNIFNGISKMQD